MQVEVSPCSSTARIWLCTITAALIAAAHPILSRAAFTGHKEICSGRHPIGGEELPDLTGTSWLLLCAVAKLPGLAGTSWLLFCTGEELPGLVEIFSWLLL